MLAGIFSIEICDHIYKVMDYCKISYGRDKPWWMPNINGKFKY